MRCFSSSRFLGFFLFRLFRSSSPSSSPRVTRPFRFPFGLSALVSYFLSRIPTCVLILTRASELDFFLCIYKHRNK